MWGVHAPRRAPWRRPPMPTAIPFIPVAWAWDQSEARWEPQTASALQRSAARRTARGFPPALLAQYVPGQLPPPPPRQYLAAQPTVTAPPTDLAVQPALELDPRTLMAVRVMGVVSTLSLLAIAGWLFSR